MRVLLRCKKTRYYFRGEDQWTPERSTARDFVTGPRAILFAREKDLSEVEVLLAFDDPRYDISLPLRTPGDRPGAGPLF